MNASGFSLCNITYEFTSVAVTTSGLGMSSAVATPQHSSFLGKCVVVNGLHCHNFNPPKALKT